MSKMNWVIEFDISAFIITAIILGLFLKKKNYPSKSNKMYLYLMLAGLSASFLDVVSVYTIICAKRVPHGLNMFINAMFLLCMNAVAFIYYFYIDALIREYEELDSKRNRLVKALAFLDFVLIATSPFTEWVFYFDNQKEYCNGPLKPVVYGIALFMLFACLFITVKNRDILSKTQKNCVYMYTVSNLIAVIVQCIFPKLLITNFAISIAFMIIYITLQRPENRIDSLTQLENRVSFLEELNREVYNKRNFYILAVRLGNLNTINETMGITLTNLVLRQFAQTLMDSNSEANLYRISGSKFVYIGRSHEEMQSTVQKIENRVKERFELHDMVVQLNVKYYLLCYPKHGKTPKELEKAIQYCMDSRNQKKDSRIIYADEKLLEEFKWKDKIKDIIDRALKNRTFEVYYQPIFNRGQKTFDTAEALIRLRDEKYGFISPDEFIPMAEKNGQIVEIGEYVLDEVCRMLSETDVIKLGIKHVHINLSAVQCMQRDLNERIQSYVQKYRLDADMLCFEITETAALHSDSLLTEKLKSITEEGFGLALDDYGSGFATFGYLFQYPFTIVKFDKEMIWQAMKEEKPEIALNYLIKMMKELGLEIVAEGVETKEQAQKLEKAGCDFFQGYFYSKPLPKEEFIEFLKNKKP